MGRPVRTLESGQLPAELDWLDLDLLQATLPAPGWETAGACFGSRDLDVFYPPEAIRSPASSAPARRICDGCTAIYPCLAAALQASRNLDYGIWGRTTARQRRTIRDALQARRSAA